MGHSYTSSLYHVVFSTKGRAMSITKEMQPKLWSYMGGIARAHKIKPHEIGGAEDHAHLMISIPSTMAIAKAVQLIKGGSSKWINDHYGDLRDFEWQEGYGAFSIGVLQKENTRKYIRSQARHHKRQTFKEEFLGFLKKHDLEYDSRYVWG